VPSTCAALLHEGAIDIGLIPSIEYLRGGPYAIVPDLAIASRGPVASVLLFTSRPIGDVRSIAMDTSSRTSVALVRVLCARLFKIAPRLEAAGPDLATMLGRCDAALIIGDNALFQPANPEQRLPVDTIDLGQAWTELTGLPFVYAFWAGREGALEPGDVETLQRARDEGVAASDDVACAYLRDMPERQTVGMRYLRDNIKYHLGDEERAGLELFYRYAAEIDLVPPVDGLRFF
jgi:chorismate dehydratase